MVISYTYKIQKCRTSEGVCQDDTAREVGTGEEQGRPSHALDTQRPGHPCAPPRVLHLVLEVLQRKPLLQYHIVWGVRGAECMPSTMLGFFDWESGKR